MKTCDCEYLTNLIEKNFDDQLEMLTKVCSIDCGTKNEEGNKKVVEIIDDALYELDATIEHHYVPDYGIHVIGRIKPENPTGKILMGGHLDTVFGEGEVEKHPVHREGDMLYGLGVSDCKGGVITILYALKALKELGCLPNKEIVMVFNCDEELCSQTSKDLFKKESEGAEAAYMFEPARDNNGIITYRPGCVDGWFEVTGIPYHSQFSNDENSASAVHEICNLVCQMYKMNDLEKGIKYDVSIVNAGERLACVGEHAHADFLCNLGENSGYEQVKGDLEKLPTLGMIPKCKTKVDHIWSFPVMERNEGTIRLYEQAKRAGKLIGLDLPECAATGSADGGYFSYYGVPAIDGLGPYMYEMHTTNEHMSIPSMLERTKLFAVMLAEL